LSTNFYYRKATDTETDEENCHIGLSAAGIFMFRVYTRKGLITSEAWKKFLAEDGRVIIDDYNRIWTPGEFSGLLDSSKNTDRAEYRNSPELTPETRITSQLRRYRDGFGHLFCNYVFS
jgi:hypothetical protein